VSVLVRVPRDFVLASIDDFLNRKVRQINFFAKRADEFAMSEPGVLKLHRLDV